MIGRRVAENTIRHLAGNTMRDFYKKLLRMSIQDVQALSRNEEIGGTEQMAMQLFQTRVQHWHMKAMEEQTLNFPDDPTSMYE